MKLNPELIRNILFTLEESQSPSDVNIANVTQSDQYEVTYHLGLLMDNGYIQGIREKLLGGDAFIDLELTLLGYNLLDDIRDDSNWDDVKTEVSQSTRDVTLAVIKAAIIKIVTGA